ncbi:MAG: hypothetical protein KGK07_13595 [Chloroflexota bacterium]|nr:hypothetical protein [Chloroflexota bacterium]
MARRRHHEHTVRWVWAIGIAALAGVAMSSRRASATPAPSPGASPINPSTGRPIVTRGGHTLTDAELRDLIARHGFADAAKAFAIAKRESGGQADVIVDTRGMSAAQLLAYWGKPAAPELSAGLWQINVLANGALVPGADVDTKASALTDPDTNAATALALSHGGSSWGPWGA